MTEGWRNSTVVDDAGVSLVEAMMALALTLLVLGGVFELLTPATALHRMLPEAAMAQQRLRYAFDRLFGDLMTAGRGPSEQAPGRLGRFLPPIVPYRLGRRASPHAHRRPMTDGVSILSVSRQAGAEATTRGPLSGQTATIELAVGPGCRPPACGHRTRDMVLVFDESGAWELFRVSGVSGARLTVERVHATDTAFAAGAVVAPVQLSHYYLDRDRVQLRRHDGWQADFPLVDQLVHLGFHFLGVTAGPNRCERPATAGQLVDIHLSELNDGPWCGPAALPFDGDLLRIRSVVVTVRVQTGVSELRGVDPRLFARPGSARGGRGWVPDLEVTFTVAPPNL
jgi:hypothetical protein